MKPNRPLLVGLCVAAAAAVYLAAVRPRLRAATELEAAAHDTRPVVNVVPAQRASRPTELVLPASLRAFQDAPIYARTTGYLARYLVDIGDRVKAGQTLAIIDSPEVDRQLAQAQATLAQAKANAALARATAKRWQELVKDNAVSSQEAEEKAAASEAGEANVRAAEAEVGRLTQLKDFEVVAAPFDGVVSARGAEVGMLITTDASRPQLFRITQQDTLRVYVSVPQSDIRAVRPGLAAEVLLNEFPGRTFTGKVVRVAGALDAATRTLLTEVQIPNEKGELYSGMFAQVRFRFTPVEPPLLIPSNAAIFRANGTTVATVDANHVVHVKLVRLGHDYGTQIEVTSGIPEGTLVVANPSDALTDGMVVEPQMPKKS